jgi:signal transduction histidine kinase
VSALLTESLRSSTFKVALICILAFGVIVLALFSYVYLATDAYVLSRSDRAIDADRADLIHAYGERGQQGLAAAIREFQTQAARPDAIYLLTDESFRHVAGNLLAWPDVARGPAGRVSFAPTGQVGHVLDRPAFRARYETLPDGFHLLVGRDVGDLNHFMTRIHIALGLVILLVFALAAVASVIVTRRTVGRIESINMTTHAIMQSGLGKRVPLRGTRDEWDHLASNLNTMLDRIEALMAEVKHVSDSVAHDLRTPLARLRGRLEKASFSQRNPANDQALLNESIGDLDDVLRMFSSMMRIAQIESAAHNAALRKVDLVEIGGEVVELFDAAGEIKRMSVGLNANEPVFIIGDRDLLFEAFANLVDNAIKHGRDGGYVQVHILKEGDWAVVRVSDDGPGISEDERQNVFRRFYRLERSRCTSGNGLGLSLVAAISRLHDAPVSLYSNEPGLRVELRFRPV